MSLFCWFKRTEKMAPQGRSSQENTNNQERNHHAAMWPVARVRPTKSYILKQQAKIRMRRELIIFKTSHI
ncbi:hypothetical protein [Thalassotalea fusca]